MIVWGVHPGTSLGGLHPEQAQKGTGFASILGKDLFLASDLF